MVSGGDNLWGFDSANSTLRRCGDTVSLLTSSNLHVLGNGVCAEADMVLGFAPRTGLGFCACFAGMAPSASCAVLQPQLLFLRSC